jgi:hypothetical protein
MTGGGGVAGAAGAVDDKRRAYAMRMGFDEPLSVTTTTS